jgi:hypothetical protein
LRVTFDRFILQFRFRICLLLIFYTASRSLP